MTIFNPTVTEGGQAAAFNAESTGTELVITHIAFGLGSYDPVGSETALANEVVRVPVASGHRVTPTQIRMNAVWNDPLANSAINEVGIFAGTTLFAVWSRSVGGALGYKTPSVDFVFNYSMLLTVVPPGSVTVVADTGTSAVLAALMEHEGNDEAHGQYMMRRRRIWTGAAGGTANALALTIPTADVFTAMESGQGFLFVAAANNTAGGVTVDVGGVDTLPLKKQGGVALDANDLVIGAVYEAMYDGSVLQLVSGNGGGAGAVNTFSTTELTATAGQTDFVVAYTVGNVMVMVDGVQQLPSSYTATDGANIVFGTGLSAGQKVLVVSFSPFTVANVVDLTSNQSVGGIKTFLSSPLVPTLAWNNVSNAIASTAQVAAAITGRVATILVAGIVRLANNTTDVANVGTGGGANDIAVTPAALAAVTANTTKRGLVELATDAEAQSFSGLLSSLALTVSNLLALRASVVDVDAASDQRFLTPKGMKDAGFLRIFESAYLNYRGSSGFGDSGVVKIYDFVNPSGLPIKHYEFYAKCLFSEGGYSVGMVIPLGTFGMSSSSTAMYGFGCFQLNANTIRMVVDSNHGLAAHDAAGTGFFKFRNFSYWDIKCVFFV